MKTPNTHSREYLSMKYLYMYSHKLWIVFTILIFQGIFAQAQLIELQLAPDSNACLGIMDVFIKVRASSIANQNIELGTSSLMFNYDSTALEYVNYVPIEFDSTTSQKAAEAHWDIQKYQVNQAYGIFNLSLLKLPEGQHHYLLDTATFIAIGKLQFRFKQHVQDTSTYLRTNIDYTSFTDRNNTNIGLENIPSISLAPKDFILNYPTVAVSTTDATCEEKGNITFLFNSDPHRNSLEFSLDGGITYQSPVADDSGSFSFEVDTGYYALSARWTGSNCGIHLDTAIIQLADTILVPCECKALPNIELSSLLNNHSWNIVSGPQVIAYEGDQLALRSNVINESQYNWTGPNTYTQLGDTANSGFILLSDSITMADSGIYRLDILYQNGCTKSTTVEVVVKGCEELPDIELSRYENDSVGYIVANDTIFVYEGEKLEINSTVNNERQYSWSGPNGFFQPGDTAIGGLVLVSDSITMADSGSYQLDILYQSGCINTTSVQVKVKTCEELPEVTLSSRINDSSWNKVLTQQIVVNAGDKLTFLSDVSDERQYVWNGPNGFSQQGDSTNSGWILLSDRISAADSGVYQLDILYRSGCINSTSIELIVLECDKLPKITLSAQVNDSSWNLLSPQKIVINEGDKLEIISNVNNEVLYNWSGPNNFNQQGDTANYGFLLLSDSVTLADNGLYQLDIFYASGCVKSTSIEVEVIGCDVLPDIGLRTRINDSSWNSILQDQIIIREGSKLALISDVNHGSQYYWTGPNNFFLKGDSLNSGLVEISEHILLGDTGTYLLELHYASGCIDSASVKVVVERLATITRTLEVIADTYTNNASQRVDDNQGTNVKMFARNRTAWGYEPYVKFDVSSFRAVSRAVLRLYGYNPKTSKTVEVAAYQTTDNWEEEVLTFSNQPGKFGDPLATATINGTQGYREWVVTDYVNAQAQEDGIVSFVMSSINNDDESIRFSTKEAGSNIPVLFVEGLEPTKEKLPQIITINPIPDKYTTDTPFRLQASSTYGLEVHFGIVSGPASVENDSLTLTGETGTVVVRASQDGNSQYEAAVPVLQSFTVTIAGCDTLPDIELNARINDSSWVAAQHQIIVKEGDKLEMLTNVPTASLYEWSGSTGFYQQGDTANAGFVLMSDDLTSADTGSYQFKVHYESGCIDSISFKLVFEQLVSTTKTLEVIADTYTNNASARINDNQGINNKMFARNRATWGYESYLKFDVTSFKFVSKAILRIYSYNPKNNNPVQVAAFQTADTWEEEVLTFANTTGKFGDPLASVSINSTAQYYEWDVTEYVNTQSLADGIVSFVMASINDDDESVRLTTREAGSNPPILYVEGLEGTGGKLPQIISFDPIPDKFITDIPFSLQASSTSGLKVSFELISGPATIEDNFLTLTGETGTVSVSAYQAGDVQFDPALSVIQTFEVLDEVIAERTIDVLADAYVNNASNQINTNYGNKNNLDVRNKSSWGYASYLRFDLSSFNQVVDVKLRVYGSNPENNVPINVQISGTSDNWSEEGITYQNAPTIGSALNTFTVSEGPKYYEIDVTDYVKNEISDNGIASFVLTSLNPSIDRARFDAKEKGGNPAQLVVRGTIGTSSQQLSSTADPINTEINWKVDVYPNPFSEDVRVMVTGPEATFLSLNIVDMLGRVVYELQGIKTRKEIPIHLGNSKGIYLLRISNGLEVLQSIRLVALDK